MNFNKIFEKNVTYDTKSDYSEKQSFNPLLGQYIFLSIFLGLRCEIKPQYSQVE